MKVHVLRQDTDVPGVALHSRESTGGGIGSSCDFVRKRPSDSRSISPEQSARHVAEPFVTLFAFRKQRNWVKILLRDYERWMMAEREVPGPPAREGSSLLPTREDRVKPAGTKAGLHPESPPKRLWVRVQEKKRTSRQHLHTQRDEKDFLTVYDQIYSGPVTRGLNGPLPPDQFERVENAIARMDAFDSLQGDNPFYFLLRTDASQLVAWNWVQNEDWVRIDRELRILAELRDRLPNEAVSNSEDAASHIDAAERVLNSAIDAKRLSVLQPQKGVQTRIAGLIRYRAEQLETIDTLRRSVLQHPNNVTARVALVRSLMNAGLLDEALTHLQITVNEETRLKTSLPLTVERLSLGHNPEPAYAEHKNVMHDVDARNAEELALAFLEKCDALVAPINLPSLVETMNAHVYSGEMDSNLIMGVTEVYADETRIVVARGLSRQWKRYVIAKELCGLTIQYLQQKPAEQSQPEPDDNYRAFFARSLLMPDVLVRDLTSIIKERGALAAAFDVPLEILDQRLDELGMAQEVQHHAAKRQAGHRRASERIPEPG